jgi:hypothetical protein
VAARARRGDQSREQGERGDATDSCNKVRTNPPGTSLPSPRLERAVLCGSLPPTRRVLCSDLDGAFHMGRLLCSARSSEDDELDSPPLSGKLSSSRVRAAHRAAFSAGLRPETVPLPLIRTSPRKLHRFFGPLCFCPTRTCVTTPEL